MNTVSTERDDGEKYARHPKNAAEINWQRLYVTAVLSSSALLFLAACNSRVNPDTLNFSTNISHETKTNQEQTRLIKIARPIQASSKERSSDTISVRSEFEAKAVGGAEVYGLNQPLNFQQLSDLDKEISRSFNTQAAEIAREKGAVAPQTQTEKLNLLYPNTRRLEYVVTQDVYTTFEKRAQNGNDVTFPEWVQYNVSLLNDLLKRQSPATSLRASMPRIIIISNYDSFGLKSVAQKDLDKNAASRFRAEDLDGIRIINTDPYELKSDYSSFTTTQDGKRILKDKGEVHEDLHRTTDYVDEYSQEFKNHDSKNPVPDFRLISLDAPGNSEEGWLSYFLSWQEQNGNRGEQVAREKSEQSADVFGLHPARPYLLFTSDSQGYFPKSAKLYAANNLPDDLNGGKYGWKEYIPADEVNLEKGDLTFPPPLFTTENQNNRPRTNWLIEFNFTNGQTGRLHIPAAVFNIAYWSGDIDLSAISINLTGGYFVGYGSQNYAEESLEVTERDSPHPPEGSVLLATGTYPHSPYKLYWYGIFK